MDDALRNYANRIDEFTESVEQLWQTEEQQANVPSNDNGGGNESERGTSAL